MAEYLVSINSATPATGEHAFRALSVPIAYARNPIGPRLAAQLSPRVRLMFMYGDRTWMDARAGQEVIRQRRMRADVTHSDRFELISNSSHHLYIDNYADFNRVLCSAAT